VQEIASKGLTLTAYKLYVAATWAWRLGIFHPSNIPAPQAAFAPTHSPDFVIFLNKNARF